MLKAVSTNTTGAPGVSPGHQLAQAATRRTLLKGLGPVVAVSLASATAVAGAVTASVAAKDNRLRATWGKENHRLHDEVEVGRLSLTIAERNALIEAMPEYQGTMRLYDLKWSHLSKMDELIRQMWAIPALTPEGRAAKVWVLLACVMDPEQGWSDYDGHPRSDDSAEQARALLIEFVGGQPGQTLREQFA
jgi:hypothetical protein